MNAWARLAVLMAALAATATPSSTASAAERGAGPEERTHRPTVHHQPSLPLLPGAADTRSGGDARAVEVGVPGNAVAGHGTSRVPDRVAGAAGARSQSPPSADPNAAGLTTGGADTAAPSGPGRPASPQAAFGEVHFTGVVAPAGEVVPATSHGWGSQLAAGGRAASHAPPVQATPGGARPAVVPSLPPAVDRLPGTLPAAVGEALAEAAGAVHAAVAAGPLGEVVAPGSAGRPADGLVAPRLEEAVTGPTAADAPAAPGDFSTVGDAAAPTAGGAAPRRAAADLRASGPMDGAATEPTEEPAARSGPAGLAGPGLAPLAAAGAAPGAASELLPPLGRVPVDEQRTSGGRELEPGSGRLVEVLPLGAGLACLGLGLGMVGLRMRRD